MILSLSFDISVFSAVSDIKHLMKVEFKAERYKGYIERFFKTTMGVLNYV